MIAIEQLKEVGKIWLAWVRLQDHDPAEVTQIFEKLRLCPTKVVKFEKKVIP
ncbi:MAG: hypothetical protein HFJ61_01680 [Akkermansia muciniphila]|nr:hypothetical protein [Akkermansia muciniphila]